jgi:GT2 family glycosyltransferase
MPIVSVVIPSYNHSRFIGNAVQSVLGQSENDLELIVVDDGSTDNSLEVLSAISDPRMRVFPQSNQGAHAAINRGLELATSEYLAILNSDDFYHPQRLEKLVGILKQHPEAGMIGSYIQVIDSEGVPLGIKHGYHDLEPWTLPDPGRSFRSGEDLRMVLLTENFWATTSNYIFSHEWLSRVGPFRPLRYAHDWDFALRIANGARLLMVPEPLMSYRFHQTNTIKENQVAMIFEICWILAVHLPQAIQTDWFQAKEQATRFDQLLNSIYVYQSERILSLMLLQNLSQNLDLALDLLKPENPLRASYIEYIKAQVEKNSPSSGRNQAEPNSKRSIVKKMASVITRGI